ncbi:MAG: hypothetical protein ACPIOQ_12530 [Promethearchaeia archaeon]
MFAKPWGKGKDFVSQTLFRRVEDPAFARFSGNTLADCSVNGDPVQSETPAADGTGHATPLDASAMHVGGWLRCPPDVCTSPLAPSLYAV